MRRGRLKWLAALTWASALAAGAVRAQEPAVAKPIPFAVLPSPAALLDDAPPPPPQATTVHEIKPLGDGPPAAAGEVPHLDVEPLAHCEEGSGGLFLSAEYLLLKPQRGDLDYAILNSAQTGHPDGTIQTLVLPTVSSFRVDAGYRFPSHWDANLSYSYLFSRGQSLTVADPNGTVYTSMTSPGGGVEQAATAVGDVRLNYNVGDFEIGRRLEFGDTFGLRLFAGSRAAFINQHVSATYNGRDANNDSVYTRVDFDGAGVRVGGEGICNVGGGFSLYGRAAGSLVEGRYDVNQSETNGTATLLNVYDKFEKVVPVTEFALGVGWERNNIRFRIGYEIVNWFNLVDRPDFVDDVHQGKLVHNLSDLSLNGLSAQLAFGF